MGEHKHRSKDSKKKSSKKEHRDSGREHKKHKSSRSSAAIDYSDPSLWVEKGQDAPEPAQPQVEAPEQQQQQPQAPRHGWMMDASFDFGDLGTAKAPPPKENKPNPDDLKISHRELNVHLKQGLAVDQYPEEKKRAIQFGDAGSNWRMMKLKRVMEQAEDEGRSIKQVGLEKYGTMEKLQEALDERAYLDARKRPKHHHRDDRRGRSDRGRDDRSHRDRDDRSNRDRDDRSSRDRDRDRQSSSSRKFVFTDTASSSSQFMRPPTTKADHSSNHASTRELPRETAPPPRAAPPATTTSIITPHQVPSKPSAGPVMSRDELNKLNAKIVKAKLMDDDDRVAELEAQYQQELQRFEAAQHGTAEDDASVQVLPTIDSQGKLYDYALSSGGGAAANVKGKQRFAGTHDKVTGERLRYSAADDGVSLMDMVRQERAGSRRATDMDMDFANRIVADATFENNLDYMDDKADIMAAKKGMSEEQKMRHAISDHKRTQQALESCRLCYHDDVPPQLAMISLGTQTYLALPNTIELTDGHCVIVPLQHATSMLECDDDVWTEVRNFQKCLMQMYHAKQCGVIFMETVTNLRSQRHTMIEAIPVPYGVYEDAPAYFKEAILMSGEEWSQHKKLIDTSSRGFRYSMVKNLPYFHVWFGLDKGYGHVIEDSKEFPHYFGKEIIGGMLDIGPERWRKNKYHQKSDNRARQLKFLESWDQWDWTKTLET
ncbi:CwfJ C-terminus 1-domain-containing protein-like protein [Gongronella butleri]|nr:CwfJ C-terminus 1-domain-containing protein-like protein [Gongronella butleri]